MPRSKQLVKSNSKKKRTRRSSPLQIPVNRYSRSPMYLPPVMIYQPPETEQMDTGTQEIVAVSSMPGSMSMPPLTRRRSPMYIPSEMDAPQMATSAVEEPMMRTVDMQPHEN